MLVRLLASLALAVGLIPSPGAKGTVNALLSISAIGAPYGAERVADSLV